MTEKIVRVLGYDCKINTTDPKHYKMCAITNTKYEGPELVNVGLGMVIPVENLTKYTLFMGGKR